MRWPVATENRIRAGADAAIGYPGFGMLDLLKLLRGLLVVAKATLVDNKLEACESVPHGHDNSDRLVQFDL